MPRGIARLPYLFCCGMAVLCATALATSYVAFIQWNRITRSHYAAFHVCNGELRLVRHQVHDAVGAPDSPWEIVFGSRERIPRMPRDPEVTLAALRKFLQGGPGFRCEVYSSFDWRTLNPVNPHRSMRNSFFIENQKGFYIVVTIPLSLLTCLFAAWPVGRWWRARRKLRKIQSAS